MAKFDINDIVDDRYMFQVTVHGFRRLRLRFWVATLLIRLGMWVAPGQNTVDSVSERDDVSTS